MFGHILPRWKKWNKNRSWTSYLLTHRRVPFICSQRSHLYITLLKVWIFLFHFQFIHASQKKTYDINNIIVSAKSVTEIMNARYIKNVHIYQCRDYFKNVSRSVPWEYRVMATMVLKGIIWNGNIYILLMRILFLRLYFSSRGRLPCSIYSFKLTKV
jgi:hypothetical protein